MRYFLDTNILVYQFDDTAPDKQRRARTLVREALGGGDGVISGQVVNEFCNLALRRFAKPFTAGQCQTYFDQVLAPLCQVGWSDDLIRRALQIADRWQVAWYDALIVAGAQVAGADQLLSEDFQAGAKFAAVTVRNPFK